MDRNTIAMLVEEGSKLASDLIRVAAKPKSKIPPSISASPTASTVKQPLPTLQETMKREQGGDYCVPCVPGKHLHRVVDSLTDAHNIVQREGKFTEVAEGKIQNAVHHLNGAEEDLEKAVISPTIKPYADELKVSIAKLRGFLRADSSGLEIATAMPERFTEMARSLERALAVSEKIQEGSYGLVKLFILDRGSQLGLGKESEKSA